jgi:hypothetical protein
MESTKQSPESSLTVAAVLAPQNPPTPTEKRPRLMEKDRQNVPLGDTMAMTGHWSIPGLRIKRDTDAFTQPFRPPFR